MVDIHSHIIYGVDDGAKTLDQSITMINDAINQGVTDIVCTPHYKKGKYECPYEDIFKNFNIVKNFTKKNNMPINLYLAREVYCSKGALDVIEKNQSFKLGGTSYILLEFSYTDSYDIDELVYSLVCKGYKPIIAHVERYQYLSIDDIINIKSSGALIQVNASTIVGDAGFKEKHKVFKLFKQGIVDFVASDVHSFRVNYLKKAYDLVKKKISVEYADKIFTTNAKRILLPDEEIEVNA